MTNAQRILTALAGAGAPLCDDCLSDSASVSPRQQVFQIATRLAADGLITRSRERICQRCGRGKTTSLAQPNGEPEVPQLPSREQKHDVPITVAHAPAEWPWSWEGNIQDALRVFLEGQDWTVTRMANTASKEVGIDLAAVIADRELLVEVKGYPLTTYAHGNRRGERKPTQPTSQAREWFAHALRSMMLLLGKYPKAEVALCFPDFPTYRRLLDAIRGSLEILGVGVYIVGSAGSVEEYLASRRSRTP
jgi:hypothetical protein